MGVGVLPVFFEFSISGEGSFRVVGFVYWGRLGLVNLRLRVVVLCAGEVAGLE